MLALLHRLHRHVSSNLLGDVPLVSGPATVSELWMQRSAGADVRVGVLLAQVPLTHQSVGFEDPLDPVDLVSHAVTPSAASTASLVSHLSDSRSRISSGSRLS